MTTTDFTVLEELDAAATLQALMDQAVEVAPTPERQGPLRADRRGHHRQGCQ